MIVAAATTAFAEHGYARTTLDAVAASVGLSRSGVLHHFPSKDALFAAVLDDRARLDAQRLETLESGPDGRGALQRLGALLDLGGDRGPDSQLLPVLNAEGLIGNAAARSFARSHLDLVRERATSALDRGRRDGSVDPEGTDAADLALLLAAVVDGLHVAKLLQPDTDVDAAYELFLDLVTGQKG